MRGVLVDQWRNHRHRSRSIRAASRAQDTDAARSCGDRVEVSGRGGGDFAGEK